MAFHGQEFFEKPGDRNRLIRHFEIRDVMMNRIKQAGVMFAQKPIRALQWSRQSDSNRRPADYKSAALPTELYRRYLRKWLDFRATIEDVAPRFAPLETEIEEK